MDAPAIVGVIAYSVIRQQRRPADYRFSFKRGGVASLAVLVGIHVYLVISGKFVLSGTGSFFPLIVCFHGGTGLPSDRD